MHCHLCGNATPNEPRICDACDDLTGKSELDAEMNGWPFSIIPNPDDGNFYLVTKDGDSFAAAHNVASARLLIAGLAALRQEPELRQRIAAMEGERQAQRELAKPATIS